MSVYTELVKAGITEESARDIDNAVHRSANIVTTEILDLRLSAFEARFDTRIAQLETRLVRSIHLSMISMTGIFAVFVAAMAWVIRP